MFYPIFIELNRRRVLVVGGGAVAERKVLGLLEAGAAVTVVSPQATPGIMQSQAEWKQREFQEPDVEGALLVITATDNPDVQQHVLDAAHRRNILVNTVDIPALCDFIVPAVVRQGDVVAGISTSGKSPTIAAALRAKLETVLTADASRAAHVMGILRAEIHERIPDAGERKRIFEKILHSGLLSWIHECDDETAIRRARAMIDEV